MQNNNDIQNTKFHQVVISVFIFIVILILFIKILFF
jgi:hypothetical protein